MTVGRYKDLFRDEPGKVLEKLDKLSKQREMNKDGKDDDAFAFDAVIELPEEQVSEASTQTENNPEDEDPEDEPKPKKKKTLDNRKYNVEEAASLIPEMETDEEDNEEDNEESQDSQVSQISQKSHIRDVTLMSLSSMTDEDYNELER